MSSSITKLVSIAFVGSLIGRALRYAFNIVIARGLGFDALGLFAFGMVIMNGGGVFARLGLDTAVQKYIPIYQTENDDARVSGLIIISLTVPFLIGGLFATILYVNWDYVLRLTNLGSNFAIQLFILGIPLIATMMVGINATYGLKETKYAVYIRDLGQSAVALTLIIAGSFIFADFRAVVVGYLISLLVGVGLAVFFLVRKNALRIDIRPVYEFRETFSFSLPLTLNAGTQYLISWTDILVLGVFVSATPLGQYQASYQTSVLLLVVVQAINSIFPSVAADLYDSGRKTRLNRVYTSVTKWVTYLTVLGLLFVIIYSGDVLSIFGTVTKPAKFALIILAIGQAVDAIVGPSGYLLIMSGYERIQLANSVAMALLNLSLNIVLVQRYGIIGAAVATGLSFALLNIFRLVEVRYLLSIQPYSWQYWKGLTAVGSTVPIMMLGRNLPFTGLPRLLFVGCFSFAAFGSLVWLFGFDEEDRILIDSLG